MKQLSSKMTECDAFKLIEEFIKKSSKLSDFDLLQKSNSSSPPSTTDSSFITNYLNENKPVDDEEETLKNIDENILVETPPKTPEMQNQTVLKLQETSVSYRRPKRPYSYYVATNFHPLDLSYLTPEQKTETVINSTIEITKTTIELRSEDKNYSKPKKKSSNDKNRLSMSLTDIKTPKQKGSTFFYNSLFKLNSKKSKSNQNNLNKTCTNEDDYCDLDDDNLFEKKPYFKRSTFLTSTMPARFSSKTNKPNAQTTNHQTQTSKLNKLFRLIFRLSPTQTKAESDLNESKFTRLFSFKSNQSLNKNNIKKKSVSNRTNSTSTNGTVGPNYQLIVTDEQPSKVLLPQINLDSLKLNETFDKRSLSPDHTELLTESFNKMNCLDNLESLKEKFYSEVADRLKRLASRSNSNCKQNNNSNEKMSLNSIDSIDIPFIDDDEQEEEEEEEEYTENHSNLQNLIKTDMSDLLIDLNKLNEFILNASYAKLDEIACDYLLKYNSVWNKIAVLFELINRAVQMASSNQNLVLKLKEIGANYIHDKYCDWIYKNGGWKSVPDIISLPRENSERIH